MAMSSSDSESEKESEELDEEHLELQREYAAMLLEEEELLVNGKTAIKYLLTRFFTMACYDRKQYDHVSCRSR